MTGAISERLEWVESGRSLMTAEKLYQCVGELIAVAKHGDDTEQNHGAREEPGEHGPLRGQATAASYPAAR